MPRAETLIVIDPAVAIVVDAVVRGLHRVRRNLTDAVGRPLSGPSSLVRHAVARGTVTLPNTLGIHRSTVAVAGLARLTGADVLNGGVGRYTRVARRR